MLSSKFGTIKKKCRKHGFWGGADTLEHGSKGERLGYMLGGFRVQETY